MFPYLLQSGCKWCYFLARPDALDLEERVDAVRPLAALRVVVLLVVLLF
jgi:hypothetical protein